MKRLRFTGPEWGGHWTGGEDGRWVRHTPRNPHGANVWRELFEDPRPSAGHGGDEYGNCTLYFRCPLFGITWWYPTGHYQTDVEMPEPGENSWIDRVFYDSAERSDP